MLAAPVTLDARVGNIFNLSAPGAAKLVEPDALSVKLLSILESTNVSIVWKPTFLDGRVLYLSTIWLCAPTLTKCPLWKIIPSDTDALVPKPVELDVIVFAATIKLAPVLVLSVRTSLSAKAFVVLFVPEFVYLTKSVMLSGLAASEPSATSINCAVIPDVVPVIVAFATAPPEKKSVSKTTLLLASLSLIFTKSISSIFKAEPVTIVPSTNISLPNLSIWFCSIVCSWVSSLACTAKPGRNKILL